MVGCLRSKRAVTLGLAAVLLTAAIICGVLYTTSNTNRSGNPGGAEGSSYDTVSTTLTNSHESKHVMIKSIFNGHCLEVLSTDGVAVILSDCRVQQNQLWKLQENGFIRSATDENKCLQARGSYFFNDVPIEINDCYDGNESQKWNIAASGEIRTPGSSNYCIDENGLGNIVTIWFCASRDDQRWELVPPTVEPSMVPSFLPTVFDPSAEPQPIMIYSERNYAYCLSPPDSASSVAIHLDRCDIGEEKLSWIIDRKDGLLRLSSNQTKCIEIVGSSLDSSSLELHNCDANKNAQKWQVGSEGTIRPRNNLNYCMDENGFKNNVYIMKCDDSIDQRWYISAAEANTSMPSKSIQPSSSPSPSANPSITPTGVLILSNHNKFCLDVPKSDVTNGVDIVLSRCEERTSQLWFIDKEGYIRSVLDRSKCIQVEGSSIYDGKSVEIHDCDTSKPFQLWDFLPSGAIKSRAGVMSYCIDGNDLDNVVFMWSCDEKGDQLWTKSESTSTPSSFLSPTLPPAPSNQEFGSQPPAPSNEEFALPTNTMSPSSPSTTGQPILSSPTKSPSTLKQTSSPVTQPIAPSPTEPSTIEPTPSPTKRPTISPTKSVTDPPTVKPPTAKPTTVKPPTKVPSPALRGDLIEIHSNLRGYCMDLDNNDTSNDSEVILAPCNAESSQRWFIGENNSLRPSLNGNKCIQVGNSGLSAGIYPKIQDCDKTKTNQRWHFRTSGEIVSQAGYIGYCLDANDMTGTIVLWSCDETSDQIWTINYDPTNKPSMSSNSPSVSPKPTYSSRPSAVPSDSPSISPTSSFDQIAIQFRENGYCMDLLNSDLTSGNDITFSKCNGEIQSQLWIIDGLGYIRSYSDKTKCIGVEGNNGSSNGASIEIQNCAQIKSQQWTILPTGAIQTRDVRYGNSYCMDGNSLNQDVIMWSCDGSSDQYWSIIQPTFKPSSSPSMSLKPSITPSFRPSVSPSIAATSIVAMIKANFNNHCLEAPNSSNGVGIILSSCSGNNSVNWIIDGHGYIRSSLDSNKCLTIRSTKNSERGFYDGSEIELSTCIDGEIRQQWQYDREAKELHTVGGSSTYCMDGNNPGQIVITWVCDESSDQFWTLL